MSDLAIHVDKHVEAYEELPAIEVESEVVDEKSPASVDVHHVVAESVITATQVADTPTTTGKRRRGSDSMSAEEAKAQAAMEGLALIRSATGVTGYVGVVFDSRAKSAKRPYAAYMPGNKGSGQCVGTFATAEEAALARSRRTGDSVERVVRPGRAYGSVCLTHTMVCRACGALVNVNEAVRTAKAAGRSDFVVGEGCGSRTCTRSKIRHTSRHVATQVKKANGLLQGTYRLITWPSGHASGVPKKHKADYTYVGEVETRSIAEAVLEANK